MRKMKIHHIGIIVDSLEKNIEIYKALGYAILYDVIEDDIQHLKICFMKSEDGTQTIELIKSDGDNSSIHNFKAGYHHICYDVSEQNDFISHFKSLKVGKIFTEPIVAPALLGNKVVFACLRNGTFVEFIISG